jgi:hypothetical protein
VIWLIKPLVFEKIVTLPGLPVSWLRSGLLYYFFLQNQSAPPSG